MCGWVSRSRAQAGAGQGLLLRFCMGLVNSDRVILLELMFVARELQQDSGAVLLYKACQTLAGSFLFLVVDPAWLAWLCWIVGFVPRDSKN